MSIILFSLTNLVVMGKEFVYMSDIMFLRFSFSLLSEGRVLVNFLIFFLYCLDVFFLTRNTYNCKSFLFCMF